MVDAITDMMSMLGVVVNAGIGFWFIAMALIFVGLGAWFMMNRRYPKVKFLIEKGGVMGKYNRRLDGKLIMEDNIMSILLNKHPLAESIDDFNRIYFMADGWRYFAFEENGALIPGIITRNDARGKVVIEPEEVRMGRKVAIRYNEAKKFATEQVKAQEPIGLALIIALPTALIVCMFVLGMYLAQDSLVKSVQSAMGDAKEMAYYSNATIGQLNIMMAKNGITGIKKYNATGGSGGS